MHLYFFKNKDFSMSYDKSHGKKGEFGRFLIAICRHSLYWIFYELLAWTELQPSNFYTTLRLATSSTFTKSTGTVTPKYMKISKQLQFSMSISRERLKNFECQVRR